MVLPFLPFVFLSLTAALGEPSLDSARCSPSETLINAPPVTTAEHRPPFTVGEDLRYSVSFGKVHVGSGEMRFFGHDTIRGQDAWKATFEISGGFSFLSVHDTSESWFDPLSFNSLRFVQGLHEPYYHANRDTKIYPDRRMFQKNREPEHPSVADPLDDVSFVYYVRTLPLEPGQCYVLHRYFQPDGNPVIVHVVRRDTISVPAGKFPALLLRPEIRTSGIFSKNGRAELWLSDDPSRLLLRLSTSFAHASINLYLNEIARPQPAESDSADRP